MDNRHGTEPKAEDVTPTEPRNAELLAIRMNRTTNKLARYESHQEYIRICLRDQLVPTNFRIDLEPSIGYHNDAFLASWYRKLQEFSRKLMQDTIQFC